MTHGSIDIAGWQALYFHQGSITYVPTEATLNTTLATDYSVTLIGPYTNVDANVKSVKVRNTVYVTPPFIGILTKNNPPLVQFLAHLHESITPEGIAV